MQLFGLGKKKNKEEFKEGIIPFPSSQNKIPEISEIKRAVSEPKQIMHQLPVLQKTNQEIQLLQPISIKPIQQEIPEENYDEVRIERPRIRIREMSDSIESPVMSKPSGPIYVKIDRFESALADFEEIKKKLNESFELLERVKSIRGREEEEIEVWEKEVENIKRKLLDIDRNLFRRADY